MNYRGAPLRLLLLASLLFTASWSTAALAASTQPALSMTVSPTGSISIFLGGRLIADGTWELFHSPGDPFAADELALSSPTARSATMESPTHAIIVHQYDKAQARYEVSLTGEDIQITAHVQNLDTAKSIRKINFAGLTFHFSRNPTGTLRSYSSSYIQANNIYYPSVANPLGCDYAADDSFGFAAHTQTDFATAIAFNAEWGADAIIPARCGLQFYTTRTIPSASAIDVDIHLRISADTSMPHLMESYKKLYDQHFPKLTYHPDNRPLLQFAAVDVSLVTPNNPLGYNSYNRRFDTRLGTIAFVNMVAPRLKRANGLGCIFWALGGYNPRGCMYRPDFDIFPPVVQANIPELVNDFRFYNLRLGLCARPGDGVKPVDATHDTTYRLSADDPQQMATLLKRFANARSMGFDIFYCDSIGCFGLNDVHIIQKIRDAVGPNVLLYTEFCSDLTLPFAGRYGEWDGNNVTWTDHNTYEVLRYLCPDSTWLCISRVKEPVPSAYTQLRLTPLVEDYLVGELLTKSFPRLP
jgi:hypothetical protein